MLRTTTDGWHGRVKARWEAQNVRIVNLVRARLGEHFCHRLVSLEISFILFEFYIAKSVDSSLSNVLANCTVIFFYSHDPSAEQRVWASLS